MEFRFRSGEKGEPSLLPSSCPFPDAYLASQPLRGGFAGIDGDNGWANLMHPMSAFEALRRELQKERIREEIIMREITERRILEEEVRQELELERARGIRRIPLVEPLMMAPPPKDEIVEPLLPGNVVHVSDVGVDKGLPLQLNPNAKVGNELALIHYKTVPKPSPTTKVSLSKHEVSGSKRKSKAIVVGSSKLLRRPAPQNWGCAICEISTTSEEGLNDHLGGKKHKAKLVLLGSSKSGTKNGDASSSTPVAFAPSVRSTSTTTHAPELDRKAHVPEVDKKTHRVLRKKRYLWCRPCRVKCNSTTAMATHLSGKRHIAQVGSSNTGYKPVGAIATDTAAAEADNNSKDAAAAAEADNNDNNKKNNNCKAEDEVIVTDAAAEVSNSDYMTEDATMSDGLNNDQEP